ncbi:MAG: 6-phosphogluconolactonase [Ignavibacteria bacterium]
MNKGNIKIFDSSKELADGFAEIFCKKISSLLINKNILNIALSGGETPIELFKVLSSDYNDKIKWNNINFFWADERCVPADSDESNYGNADIYLFSKIRINPANIHKINGEDNPLNESARYSKEVKDNISVRNGLPSFDVILLGIGEDGHTASIFPNQMGLMQSEKVYDVAFHPVSSQRRITITGRVINNSADVSFLVSGGNKAEIVGKILNNKSSNKNLPAAVIAPSKGTINWYMDSDAAGQLKK